MTSSSADGFAEKLADSRRILRRDLTSLLSMQDNKVEEGQGKTILYYAELPGQSGEGERIAAELTAALGEGWSTRVALTVLPEDFRDHPEKLKALEEHGLLYLPYPYLVPGGRFNEMYGWDSAFGVWAYQKEDPELVRQMVDNQLYQINHYGAVLNANRSYYLTRSQPPLISMMVRSVMEAAREEGFAPFDPQGTASDLNSWLSNAYDALERYYSYWTSGERYHAATGLSRYVDAGDWPAPEVITGEPGHYEHALSYMRQLYHAPERTEQDTYLLSQYYDPIADTLTPSYYKGDRSMRASGFDPSSRWGYGNIDAFQHAPVCLNSLLHQMEKDMEAIATFLGKTQEATNWQSRAGKRREAMDQWMWDEDSGQYADYHLLTGKRNSYDFATGFWPLWAGVIAADDPRQKRMVDRLLETFETPHGIVTSTQHSGSQWDWPYGWPPLQWFAVEALSRAGRDADAQRIAEHFLTLMKSQFDERGAMFEKYDVVHGTANVIVDHGYSENVQENGTFLWTAGVAKMFDEKLKALAGHTQQALGVDAQVIPLAAGSAGLSASAVVST